MLLGTTVVALRCSTVLWGKHDDEFTVQFAPSAARHSPPEDDEFTVQFAPSIAQCSPGGGDTADAWVHPNYKSPSRASKSPAVDTSKKPHRPRRPPQPTHYDVLGVEPDAPIDTIRSAFAALVKEHHPDVGGDRAKFEPIVRAWTALKSPSARAAYDAVRPKKKGSII